MPRSLALVVALAAMTASPLSAQSLKFAGTVDAGVTDMTRDPMFGAVDMTVSAPLAVQGRLAFEFGAYLFALDGKKPHETYAAFTWDDRFRLGVVRPAYDLVLPSVFEHTAPFLAYQRAEYGRSFNTVEAMRHTAVPWGLSAQGSAGSMDWVVSAHRAEKGGFSAASAAVTYTGQGYRLMAAVETIRDDAGALDGTNAKIGARFDLGRSEFGIAWLHPDANARPDALSLDARIPLTGQITLAALGEFTEGAKDDAYGLALTRKFGKYGATTVAVTDGAAGPGLHLTHSYRF